jgi:hypothetical protein
LLFPAARQHKRCRQHHEQRNVTTAEKTEKVTALERWLGGMLKSLHGDRVLLDQAAAAAGLIRIQ